MTFSVEAVIPALADSLARNRSVVLRAPPGCGKTTCVPPALLNAPFLNGKKILMLEPRRLAARACASFIASKLGEAVGETVGYQVRLERKISSRTRLEIVTEGLLAQRLLSDPELSDVGLIIFDEFHERSLACDLGFALALDVRRALRDDLRLLVMSATLDAEPIANFLGDADVHTAEARMFPVETHFLREDVRGPISSAVAAAVRRALAENPEGDVLCFLPGEGEIRRAEEELRDLTPAVAVLPLYGALAKDEQDRVLKPLPQRKVILATSIAETSLTIEGVRVVIDSGLMRVPRFSAASGMSRLETLRITRNRADQRRGRAGRTAPGVCYRLWSELTDRVLLPAMKPEICEADLASTVLATAEWGTCDATKIPFLTPPPEANWQRAISLLQNLGALDAASHLTDHGRKMSRFAAHPRLANMMLRAGGEETCLLAAILEEQVSGPLRHETDIRRLLDYVRGTSNNNFARRVTELARRWQRTVNHAQLNLACGEQLAFAFPDRIARNRGNATFQMTCGRGAAMDRTEVLSTSEYLIICDLNDAGGDAKIFLACPITQESIEQIFAQAITERTRTEWDKRTEQVIAVRERVLGKMVMRSGGQANANADDIRRALFEGIRLKGVAQLEWSAGARQLQARINFLHRVLGNDWPDVSDTTLAEHLEDYFTPFVDGMTRWTHLARLDLASILDAALGLAGRTRRELDALAPTKMEVPSGSAMTIHYEEEEPFVQVRLQECFGLQSTPRVAGGRVPIVMKLLSPAQRPVQITKDLASFWREGYALVRKDLRGRYPKHYWPEDPFTAVATRRVRPK